MTFLGKCLLKCSLLQFLSFQGTIHAILFLLDSLLHLFTICMDVGIQGQLQNRQECIEIQLGQAWANPHITMTALSMCVYACLDRPLTINFKWAHSNIYKDRYPVLVESNCWNAASSATRCMYSVWLAATCTYANTSSLPQAGVPKVYISGIWSSPRLICDAVYFLPRWGCRTARRAPSLPVSAADLQKSTLAKLGSGRPGK